MEGLEHCLNVSQSFALLLDFLLEPVLHSFDIFPQARTNTVEFLLDVGVAGLRSRVLRCIAPAQFGAELEIESLSLGPVLGIKGLVGALCPRKCTRCGALGGCCPLQVRKITLST